MGAHGSPPSPMRALYLLLLISTTVASNFNSESLLEFKSSLADPSGALSNWNASLNPPCTSDISNWIGVLCWNDQIWGLQLEGMDLTGEININALSRLPYLRTLSFINNNFQGPIPQFNRLPALKSIFLSGNQFDGSIPDNAFSGMNYLKKVMLENNRFSGEIPKSLAALPRLLELRLDGNGFVGSIPPFQSKGLQMLNISNNNLAGPIPPAFSKLPISLFWGNEDLCGHPLESCEEPRIHPDISPSQPPVSKGDANELPTSAMHHTKSSSTNKIVIISLAVALSLAAAALSFVLLYPRKCVVASKPDQPVVIDTGTAATPRTTDAPLASTKRGEQGKLSFIKEDREQFDLLDLLRASAEVLGSGNFGASYKAVVFGGQPVVVKRFKLMNSVGKEEFHEHMRRLGRLNNVNLLPLVAYYYRKEEKLLVFDFVKQGSLASHLHGKHTGEQRGLDWTTRLKVIKGVVNGMVYLHNELPSLILPHGHLKSSNVLLNESLEPLLMDYGLVPLINLESAQHFMIAYKSPEYAQLGRTLRKTDVWSIGILILEVLTGRFPGGYLAQESSDAELAKWVDLIAREEREERLVFDKDMEGRDDAEGEMRKALKIGLGACEEDAKKRWDLGEVSQKVAELKERDFDE